MSQPHNWNIVGANQLADALREAAQVVEAGAPITVLTEPGESGADDVAVGSAVLSTVAERFVPFYSAFEAIEETKRTLDAGDAGRVYGCFTSFRIPRGAAPGVVTLNALLPAMGVTLDLLPGNITRVFARRASLFAEEDAWYVTLRFDDDRIATVEAMAATQPATGMELLVEVTASERVLRAEPTRQAVVVERVGQSPRAWPWWEDLRERYLRLVAERAAQPSGNAGSRFRSVWSAMHESAKTGKPAQVSS